MTDSRPQLVTSTTTTVLSAATPASDATGGKEVVEGISELISRINGQREEIKALKMENQALRGAGSFSAKYIFAPLRQWAGPLAVLGWLVLFVYLVSCSFAALAAVRYFMSGEHSTRVPFDPITKTRRMGVCSEEPGRLCVEMVAEQALNASIGSFNSNGGRHTRVAFWNSTRDSTFDERFKHMYITKASESSYAVITARGMVNLRDIRDNLQRKVYRGEYAFACATFLGFPIDYCVFYIQRNTSDYTHEWVDVIGNIVITSIDYDTTVVTASVPSGLCEHAGIGGQSPVHLAKYFSRACFVYRGMNQQRREECVTGMDAITIFQLYEMQKGIVSCCDDADRLPRLLSRFRQDSVTRM